MTLTTHDIRNVLMANSDRLYHVYRHNGHEALANALRRVHISTLRAFASETGDRMIRRGYDEGLLRTVAAIVHERQHEKPEVRDGAIVITRLCDIEEPAQ